MRRGNLNGLPNFLDIFRTLNALLLAYHRKRLGRGGQVVPFGYVIQGIIINLELLIGPFEGGVADWYEGRGFVASIFTNLAGDTEFVRERLQEDRVPQMVRAAAEAMVRCRAQALRLTSLDTWSQSRLRWVTDWIRRNELSPPTPDEDPGSGEGVWSNAQGGLTSVVLPDTEFSRSVGLSLISN